MRNLYRLPKRGQKQKIEPLASLEMKKEGFVLQPAESPLSNILHHSCKTFPLESFIQAYCNNDLSGLGEGSQDELSAAWNEILFEYSGLIKSENSDYIFNLMKEIGILEHHIIYIDYAVTFLLLRYDEDIANEVRGLGYSVPQPTDEGYSKAINLISELAKRKVFDHSNLVEEYTRLNKTLSGKKQSEEDFYSTVAAISRYQGYDIFKVTVFIFTQIFNNYIKEMKVREVHLQKY